MNEIEYVFGIGDAVVHPWSSNELADTGDTLWIDYDTGVDYDAFLPDIPLATADHRTVLAQEPAGEVSSPPWLDGN
ncbi:hypothetical protein [Nocardia alba]|uniref:Uncharacterized protein n=1 Tax=Nocardia alba TaxID=225051 RepID=A0A4R1FZQ3_9NOCA|nr:hypothetical protein [Nocardia alba]TCK00774.1 hypothetical protein DFR71_1784 [Nocardia alba]